MFHVSVSCFHNNYKRATLISLYSLLAKICVGNDTFSMISYTNIWKEETSKSKMTILELFIY